MNISNTMGDIADLEAKARLLRLRIIENSHKSGTPHLGGCLSSVDILTALYFQIMNIDPATPLDPNRDRFILSKGHGVPALYQVLALRGYFPHSWMDTYGENGSLFGEHPSVPGKIPGIEAAPGSLGHGLPVGSGMAVAARLLGQPYSVYVVLGDGECNEGSVWEAAMFAGGQKLSKLVAIVDYNQWQATGRSNDILALGPLVDKWRSFGWAAEEVDGHDMAALVDRLSQAPDEQGRPRALIAHTVKGKGVSFMEDDNDWHYRIPTVENVAASRHELGLDA